MKKKLDLKQCKWLLLEFEAKLLHAKYLRFLNISIIESTKNKQYWKWILQLYVISKFINCSWYSVLNKTPVQNNLKFSLYYTTSKTYLQIQIPALMKKSHYFSVNSTTEDSLHKTHLYFWQFLTDLKWDLYDGKKEHMKNQHKHYIFKSQNTRSCVA